MIGVNNQTGLHLSGLEHLKQSVIDILLTPLGTRVMRRDYGSRLFDLIDAPMNSGTVIDIITATAEALAKWEPRIAVERVTLDEGNDTGRIGLTLFGKYLPDGQPIKLDGILLNPPPPQTAIPLPSAHGLAVITHSGSLIRVPTPGYLYILNHDSVSVPVAVS